MHLAPAVAARVAATRGHQDGQGLAEYSLLLAFIAMMAIVSLLFLGGDIMRTLSFVGSTVSSVIH